MLCWNDKRLNGFSVTIRWDVGFNNFYNSKRAFHFISIYEGCNCEWKRMAIISWSKSDLVDAIK